MAIMASMLFSALNQTTVGTALPIIVTDLGGLEYFSWIFTSYILAAAIPAVIVGRLSDIYGRKPFILWGLAIFIVGSLLAGLARDIIELIIYRVIQGVGGGVIMATAFTAIGDLFVPRERGKWQGMMGASFGLASVFGPTLGGYIVDNWHWNWVFWVFTPLGIVAFVMIWIMFPKVEKKEGYKVDYLGSFLLTITVVPILLAFSWAGQKYAWGSNEILGLFGFAFVALIAFIYTEKKVSHPILPLELFHNSIFTISNIIVFIMGASMFGSLLYMPLYLQGVAGHSATLSGTMMMPMTLSMVAASILGGRAITKMGKYKLLAFFGLAVTAVGMYLLSTMDAHTPTGVLMAYILVTGLGLGIGMPVFTLTVQNAVDHGYLGVATASGQLFRQLGGTIGVALMGTVMAHSMHTMLEANIKKVVDPQVMASLPKEVMSHLEDPQLLLNPQQLVHLTAHLPQETKTVIAKVIEVMREALNSGLANVFVSGALAMAVAIVFVFFLKEIPLRTTMHKEEK